MKALKFKRDVDCVLKDHRQQEQIDWPSLFFYDGKLDLM